MSAAEVAGAAFMSKSNVYKLYNKSSLDSEMLVRLSALLKVNLFDYYYEDDRLKNIKGSRVYNLEQLLEEKTQQLALAEAEIARLKQALSDQRKLSAAMEKKIRDLRKKQEKEQGKPQ
jgi:hypothetical protein